MLMMMMMGYRTDRRYSIYLWCLEFDAGILNELRLCYSLELGVGEERISTL